MCHQTWFNGTKEVKYRNGASVSLNGKSSDKIYVIDEAKETKKEDDSKKKGVVDMFSQDSDMFSEHYHVSSWMI